MFHLSWRAATNLVVFLIVDGILKPRKCVHRGQNMWDHITYWQIAIYDFPLHSPLVVSLFSGLFKNLKKGPLLGDCKLAQSKQILKIEKGKWKRVEDHLIFFGNNTSIYTDIFLELLAFNTIDYFFLKYFLLWISVTPCSLVLSPYLIGCSFSMSFSHLNSIRPLNNPMFCLLLFLSPFSPHPTFSP